jgi:hypothetical protein
MRELLAIPYQSAKATTEEIWIRESAFTAPSNRMRAAVGVPFISAMQAFVSSR